MIIINMIVINHHALFYFFRNLVGRLRSHGRSHVEWEFPQYRVRHLYVGTLCLPTRWRRRRHDSRTPGVGFTERTKKSSHGAGFPERRKGPWIGNLESRSKFYTNLLIFITLFWRKLYLLYSNLKVQFFKNLQTKIRF